MERDQAEIFIDNESITNSFYVPKFMEYVTLQFMPYISICGSMMLPLIDKNISRVSNAFVESNNKVLKCNVLKNQKFNSIGSVVRKLQEHMEILAKEASLKTSIGQKMNLHSKKHHCIQILKTIRLCRTFGNMGLKRLEKKKRIFRCMLSKD